MTEITRQHLEDAALAAALRHVSYEGSEYDGRDGLVLVDDIGRLLDDWRPHLDDGDAFRLMIKMKMRVEILPCWATAVIDGEEENGMRYDAPEELPGAARTVIVLCAADVGRRMRGER
jgi:hypothetical protein